MSGADELGVSSGGEASEKPLSSYEIFLLALVAYSTLNLILLILPLHTYQTRVVLIMDAIVGILFFFDFLYRLIRVPDRTDYFFRQAGWLDLIAGLPAPGLRLAKLVRLHPTIKGWRHQGLFRGMHRTSSNRATVALLIAVFCTFMVVQFGSMLVIGPEQKADGSNIETAEEAIWWSYVTITTVGYGDYYPVSVQGRLVGILLLTLGIALFAVITSFLSNAFIYPHREREEDRKRQIANQETIEDLRFRVALLQTELQSLTTEIRKQSNGSRAGED